ncbi:hypothetical protein MAPG_05246 [Magnaporthiopsis poae ATCC 64411]|uniref:Uncharacterized protein n=1 Tax=Magnaporthiopsis poae (strain ATCC 64411 / 73-15) TaxID=644358 RepID=A0A0C4DYW5_MAGP6|nr:hypothetical protein MAPG_05246 [Magnaporthiopsis poae ATCC 64411]
MHLGAPAPDLVPNPVFCPGTATKITTPHLGMVDDRWCRGPDVCEIAETRDRHNGTGQKGSHECRQTAGWAFHRRAGACAIQRVAAA